MSGQLKSETSSRYNRKIYSSDFSQRFWNSCRFRSFSKSEPRNVLGCEKLSKAKKRPYREVVLHVWAQDRFAKLFVILESEATIPDGEEAELHLEPLILDLRFSFCYRTV